MSTLHNSRTFAAAMVLMLAMASIAGADTLLSTNGDTTYERVYFGYGGPSQENLSALLANYVNPVTGLPDPILRPDGTPLIGGLLTYPDGTNVPEPATMALLGSGLGITLALRRKRNRPSRADSNDT